MKTIVFGEVIFDIYPDEALLGGAPLNFAAHLAALGNNAWLFSAVGKNDEYGKRVLSALERYGIDDTLMQKNDAPTGSCRVTLDENKIPCYKIATACAHDRISVTEHELQTIRAIGADVFYFNTLIQRDKASRETLKTILATCAFPDIFCDINLREGCYDRESIISCLSHATYFKLSDGEVDALYDFGLLPRATSLSEVPRLLCEKYPNIRYAILTLGSEGSMVYDASAAMLCRSEIPEKVTVVSTVGAGDCYGATFLHAIYRGKSVPDAIKDATLRSGIVVSHKEAVPF